MEGSARIAVNTYKDYQVADKHAIFYEITAAIYASRDSHNYRWVVSSS
jgi:hypothetical protein